MVNVEYLIKETERAEGKIVQSVILDGEKTSFEHADVSLRVEFPEGYNSNNVSNLQRLPDGTIVGLHDKEIFVCRPVGTSEETDIGGYSKPRDVNAINSNSRTLVVALIADKMVVCSVGYLGPVQFGPSSFSCTRIYQILPDERVLYQTPEGALAVCKVPWSSQPEVIFEPNEEYGTYTVARVTPDGKIYVGTDKGKVIILDGDEVKKDAVPK